MKNILKFGLFLSFFAASFVSCNSGEDVIITNPYTSSSGDSKLFVQRVEVNNNYTILDFVSLNMSDTSSFEFIFLDEGSYIETAGGKKYKLLKTEGVNAGSNHSARTYFTTIDNYIHFRLYFEPIPKKTQIISFVEPDGWRIDDISLTDSYSHGPLRYNYNHYEFNAGNVGTLKPTVLAISGFTNNGHDEWSMYFSHQLLALSAQVTVTDCKDFQSDYYSVVNNGYYNDFQSFSGNEYRVRQLVIMNENEIMAGDIHAYYRDNKKYEVIYMWGYGFAPMDDLVDQYIDENAIAIAFDDRDVEQITNRYIPLTKVYAVEPNCIHTTFQDFEVTSIELRDNCTLVHKRCIPTAKDDTLGVFSTKDAFIEDAVSGKKYFLTKSSIGIGADYRSMQLPNTPVDFVETYPAISGVQSLNINSGTAYYLKNIDISK